MADHQSLGDRIFAFENVNTSAADGGRGNPDKRIERTHAGMRFSSRTIRPDPATTAALMVAMSLSRVPSI
jgi:hypothetical protein